MSVKKKLLDEKISYEERCRTRRKIAKQKEEFKKKQSLYQNLKNGTLLKDFDLCDELNKEVLFPSEAVVELAAQSNLHGYADQAIRGLARAVDITPNEFLGGIKEYIADCEDGITAIDWKQIGKCAAPFLASAPSPTFFAGSLMHQVQQKPSRQKKKRRIQDDAGEVVNPTQVVDTSKEEKAHTEGRVRDLHKLIKHKAKRKKKSIFEIILNPNSFAQTVENLFDLSFLVKIGKVKMTIEEDIPYIQAFNYTKLQNADDLPKHQGIMKLDRNLFETLVEVMNVEEPFIPSREVV